MQVVYIWPWHDKPNQLMIMKDLILFYIGSQAHFKKVSFLVVVLWLPALEEAKWGKCFVFSVRSHMKYSLFILHMFFNFIKIKFSLVSSIVILCRAQSQVDVDKLFHANPPSLSPNRPANAQRPLSSQNTDPSIIGIFDEDFKPFRGSRHDEFDWALTKVCLTFHWLYSMKHVDETSNA